MASSSRILLLKESMDYINNSWHYVVLGEPIPYRQMKDGRRREFDEQSQEKLRFGLTIQNIHGERPLYCGPLQIDIAFYFPVPRNLPKCSGPFYVSKPRLSSLIKFVEESIQGILSYNNCTIASTIAKKLYDSTPRTEFTLTEIKNDKET